MRNENTTANGGGRRRGGVVNHVGGNANNTLQIGATDDSDVTVTNYVGGNANNCIQAGVIHGDINLGR